MKDNRRDYKSRCGDILLTGTRDYIRKAYERLGYEAERDKDHVLSQIYFQHAEHWKKPKE